MTVVVVDASIAVKWLIDEPETPLAMRVHRHWVTLAPDLLVAECTNILWKKHRLRQVGDNAVEAALAALEVINTGLWPMRRLVRPGLDLARRLNHPA